MLNSGKDARIVAEHRRVDTVRRNTSFLIKYPAEVSEGRRLEGKNLYRQIYFVWIPS
jgi:hypothetical protein